MADQQLTGGRFVHLVRHLLAELGFRVQILFGAELALGRACRLVAPAAVHAVQLQQLPLAWRHSLGDLDRLVNAVLAAELDHDFRLLDLQLDHRLVAAFLDVGQRRRVHHRLALGRAQSAAHFDSFAGRRLRGCAGSAGSGAAIASVAADLDAQRGVAELVAAFGAGAAGLTARLVVGEGTRFAAHAAVVAVHADLVLAAEEYVQVAHAFDVDAVRLVQAAAFVR